MAYAAIRSTVAELAAVAVAVGRAGGTVVAGTGVGGSEAGVADATNGGNCSTSSSAQQ